MTPRRRWRRTDRPQTPRNSLLRSDFCGNLPEHKVKKIARRFERSARVLRLIYVGAVIPPHRLYSARAPIHPKRPIWLDPSGCPPGRVFHFGTVFLEDAASRVTARARQPQAAVDVRDAPISPRIFSMKLSRLASQHGHAAVQLEREER